MFKKFALALITLLFTCSALELEIGEAKQTFFDAYDTYVASKPVKVNKYQVSNSNSKSFKPAKKSEFESRALNFCFSFRTIIEQFNTVYCSLLSTHPPLTILLKKSELRI